jgi:exopolysaccharide biosynthesis polyprenyl glycosylphosphotransferase
MLKGHARQLERLGWLLDIIVSGLLFVGLMSLEDLHRVTGVTRADDWRLVGLGIAAALAWPILLDQLGLYDSQRRKAIFEMVVRLVLASALSTALVAITAFLTAAPVARRFPFYLGFSQLVVFGLIRIPILSLLRAVRRRGRNYRDVLIVGSGPRALRVRDVIQRHPEWGIRIAGFVDEGDFAAASALGDQRIHKLSELPALLREIVVDEVILGCPLSMLPSLGPVVGLCGETGIPLTLLSDLFGDDLPPPRVSRLGSLSALSFAPVRHNHLELAVKRAIDLVGAALLLVLSAPILGVSALLIRATSPGPVFFRQRRCGLYGRIFTCLKLRTMVDGAEGLKVELCELNEMDGPVFKIKRDPRITPIGRFLRKWSIDELPQLWNVLWGDMSLVGPRPPLPDEVERYATFERRRLSMRPGITCLWQVRGRNEIGFQEWVKLDLEYIDNWSLARDIEILLRTVPTALRGSGM